MMKAAQVLLAGAAAIGSTAAAVPASEVVTEHGAWSGVYRVQARAGGRYVASLTRADGACEALLLDEHSYRMSRRAQGKSVRVDGERIRYPAIAEGVTELAIGDRWLTTGYCDAAKTVIWVHTIRRM